MAPDPFKRSPQSRKVFEFIVSEVSGGTGFPSLAAIAAYMGWKHEASASDCLNGLVARGVVAYRADPSNPRRIIYSVKGAP